MWIEAGMWGGFGGSATRVDPIHPDDVSRPAPSLTVLSDDMLFFLPFLLSVWTE